MAASSGISALIQPNLSDRLVNTLFNIMPAFFFIFNRDGKKSGHLGLGRPRVKGQNGGIFVSGVKTAQAKRAQILSAMEYKPFVQKSKPAVTDGKTISSSADNSPVRTGWEGALTSSYFTRPSVKWCERADPYKVATKEIRHTTDSAPNEQSGWDGIISLFKAETESVLGVHEEWWNSRLWGTGLMDDGTANTGAPTDDSADQWNNLYSFQKALDTTSTYCGVDRTVAGNAYWKGADTSSMPTVFDVEKIVNYANYDLGLSKKGLGIDLLLVDGTNFQKAKSEAKAKGHKLIYNGDNIPEFGRFGFQKELVLVDNTYVCYDAECPTGHICGLNLATWTVAIHPQANFRITEPFEQSKVEGGDRALAGEIDTQILMVCEDPAHNFYKTGVTS